jgi:hypothetical protein
MILVDVWGRCVTRYDGTQAAVESIVEGLFSVLVTMGVVPIIRCPKVHHQRSAHGVQACSVHYSVIVTVTRFGSCPGNILPRRGE